jgi:hypothetical protein
VTAEAEKSHPNQRLLSRDFKGHLVSSSREFSRNERKKAVNTMAKGILVADKILRPVAMALHFGLRDRGADLRRAQIAGLRFPWN